MGVLKTSFLLCLLVAVGCAQIFPPKWYPGDVMDTTKHADIDNALSEVLRSKNILAIRSVSIGIASLAGNLVNPRTAIKDGELHSTMPPDIKPKQTGLLLFNKYIIGLKGVWGVVAYDIEGTGLKLAVMFSVPFDLLIYKIKFNLKVYTDDVSVDKKLVDQMLDHAGPWDPIGYEKRTEYGVNMTGTITNNPDAKLIVWVNAANADITKGATRHSKCQFKTTALGKRCSRECTPLGWCWSYVPCDDDTECHGNMECDGSCGDT